MKEDILTHLKQNKTTGTLTGDSATLPYLIQHISQFIYLYVNVK